MAKNFYSSYQTDEPFCTNSKGERVYQSGNDALNPNGFKRYVIKGNEIWAYNYKDAVMKNKVGLIYKKGRS